VILLVEETARERPDFLKMIGVSTLEAIERGPDQLRLVRAVLDPVVKEGGGGEASRSREQRGNENPARVEEEVTAFAIEWRAREEPGVEGLPGEREGMSLF
jgi:hypothetical protein